MNLVKIIGLSAIILFITACSHTSPSLRSQLTTNEKSQLEPIYRFTTIPRQASFIVKSHGCTLPEHFTLKQSINAKGKLELALLRLKQDKCRAMPRAFPVHFKLEDHDATMHDIELLNKIEAQQKLPRNSKSNRNSS